MTCTICDTDLLLSTWTFDEDGNIQSKDECTNSSYFANEEDFCKCFDLSTEEWKSICNSNSTTNDNEHSEITTIVCLCAKCGGLVDKLKSLYEQLKQIQMELSAVKGNLLMEIVNQPINSQLNQLKSITSNNNNSFRQFMQKRFSPVINTNGLDIKGRILNIKRDLTTITNYSENDNHNNNDIQIEMDMEFQSDFDQHEPLNENEENSSDDNNNDDDDDYSEDKKARKKPKRTKSTNKTIAKQQKRIKTKPENQATVQISPGVFRFREKWDFEKLGEGLKVKCLTCQQIFPRRSKVIFHIMKDHNLEKSRCARCKKSWKTQELLDTHNCRPRPFIRKLKTKVQPDGKTVIYDGQWEYTKIDETLDLYICGTCQVTKRGKKVMNCHIKERHIDPARHVCEVCGRAFGSKKHFVCHMELHSNEHYVCDQCGHVAKTRATLYLHKQTHSTWLCPYCQQTYTRKRGLKVHVQTYHANELAADIDRPPSPLNKILLPPPIRNIDNNTSLVNLDIMDTSTASGGQKMRQSKISNELPVYCPNCRRKYATSKTLAFHLSTCRITELVCPEPECAGRAPFESYEPYHAHLYRHRKHKEKQQQQQQQEQQQETSQQSIQQ